jgi:hypothetical protein
MSESDADIEDAIPEKILSECDGLTDDDLPMCSSPAGHSLDPVNDEKGGPQTRMVCLYCSASRPVRDGDLEKHHGEYPEWVATDGGEKA